MEGPEITPPRPSIDNGRFGTRTIRFETGRLARQAAGSAVAYLDDDTMLLSATTAGKHPKDQFDFFPLTVDVEERMYAAGRIPGSFFRREGRPTEDAILTCRLIDRPLRPSFVKGLRNEVQVVVTVMALDPDDLYDVVAINAASMSTQLAGLPFTGPIGATRVALIDGQWVAFPTHERARAGRLRHGRRRPRRRRRRRDHDGRGRGHRRTRSSSIAGGATAPTEEVVAAGPRGRQAVHPRRCARRRPSSPPTAAKPTGEFPRLPRLPGRRLRRRRRPRSATSSPQALTIAGKQEREAELDRIKALGRRACSPASSRAARRRSAPRSARVTKKLVRQRVLRDKVRIDGRGLDRHPPAVGRGRGAPAGARLGAVRARRDPDPGRHHAEHAPHGAAARHALARRTRKRYMHNYNFPPYSTGETGRVGSPKRREIGHGALAERALRAGAAGARGVPLRDPPGVRGARLQRLDVDGLGLRLDDVAAQRRCAAARRRSPASRWA